jgi:hypothetical protein
MWNAHREEMLQARRAREDCKSGPVSNILGRTGKLDHSDSRGETVGMRPDTFSHNSPATPEDAAEQQAMPPRLSNPYWPPKVHAVPVEDRLLTKLDRLEKVVQHLQRKQLDIKVALIEAGEGYVSMGTLRITKG